MFNHFHVVKTDQVLNVVQRKRHVAALDADFLPKLSVEDLPLNFVFCPQFVHCIIFDRKPSLELNLYYLSSSWYYMDIIIDY